jgi:hypothetical protein
MQANKASKKTRNSAEEIVAAGTELNSKTEKPAKPRTPRSSKAKKAETVDAVSANHHHKAAPPIAPDETVVETSPKTLAVSAGAGSSSVESAVIDPASEVVSSAVPSSEPAEIAPAEVAPVEVASAEAVPVAEIPPREVTYEEIAQLAHSYWLARGCTNGSAEEDWARAERELRARR